MENVDYIALPSTSESEVPAEAVDVYTLEKALKISKKHIWIQPYEARNAVSYTHLCGGRSKKKSGWTWWICSTTCLLYTSRCV